MIDNDEKLKFINNYLNNYFDKWLFNDIDLMERHELKFTLPYILLIFSGIDFLSILKFGITKVNKNSFPSTRSKHFITNYMYKATKNETYKNKDIANFLYDHVRNGAVHYSMYKESVSCSSDLEVYPKEAHLHIDSSDNNKDFIIIQIQKFIEDFKLAYKYFKINYIENNIDDVFNKLNEMLDDKNNYDNNAINFLKSKGKIFQIINTYPNAQPSQSVGSSSSGQIYYDII